MKRTMIVLMIAMLVLVGCSDKSPDYNTYTSNVPQTGQESVGGGCGLEAPEKPNILGNAQYIRESL